jgi:hypothetical protein
VFYHPLRALLSVERHIGARSAQLTVPEFSPELIDALNGIGLTLHFFAAFAFEKVPTASTLDGLLISAILIYH